MHGQIEAQEQKYHPLELIPDSVRHAGDHGRIMDIAFAEHDHGRRVSIFK